MIHCQYNNEKPTETTTNRSKVMKTKEYTREDKELQEEKLKNLLLRLWLKNELGVAENSLMLFRLVKWTEKLNEMKNI